MKKIIDMCKDGRDAPNDVVKLRLRGQGSGFREGHLRRESPEPLHLCVSSLMFDRFKIACQEVERLVEQLYKDYANFQRKRRKVTPRLQIKKVENAPVKAINICLNEANLCLDC